MSYNAGGNFSLTVIFPCYNEAGNVADTVTCALEYLHSQSYDFEILIVNDGSRDQTGRLANELARSDGRVRVIHHPENRGCGAALRSGFYAARKRWVFYTDGDGQFDITELPRVLALGDKFDMVSGYRLNRQDPPIRRVMGWAWTRLMDALFDLKLRDIDCAFKLFRREIFDRIELKSDGAFMITEVLARAVVRGYTLGQVGVTHYPRRRGTASGGKPAVIARSFRDVLKLRKDVLAGSEGERSLSEK